MVAGETPASQPSATGLPRLQWSPGLVAGETSKRSVSSGRTPTSFNGAPAWSPGKLRAAVARLGVSRPASMEPRLGRRGNYLLAGFTSDDWTLQWSPGLVAGETPSFWQTRSSRRRGFNGAPAWSPGKRGHVDEGLLRVGRASMEPRLGRRGNEVPGEGVARRDVASMEPRLGRRGNTLTVPVGPAGTTLQWSPGLVAGETRLALLRADRRCHELQWSPGLVAGETACSRAAGTGLSGFNGAPAWSPGKLDGPQRVLDAVGASMEPRLGRRGNRTP